MKDKRKPDYCLKCKTNHTTTICSNTAHIETKWVEVDSDCWDGQ